MVSERDLANPRRAISPYETFPCTTPNNGDHLTIAPTPDQRYHACRGMASFFVSPAKWVARGE